MKLLPRKSLVLSFASLSVIFIHKQDVFTPTPNEPLELFLWSMDSWSGHREDKIVEDRELNKNLALRKLFFEMEFSLGSHFFGSCPVLWGLIHLQPFLLT